MSITNGLMMFNIAMLVISIIMLIRAFIKMEYLLAITWSVTGAIYALLILDSVGYI
jgi:hypothetical protein